MSKIKVTCADVRTSMSGGALVSEGAGFTADRCADPAKARVHLSECAWVGTHMRVGERARYALRALVGIGELGVHEGALRQAAHECVDALTGEQLLTLAASALKPADVTVPLEDDGKSTAKADARLAAMQPMHGLADADVPALCEWADAYDRTNALTLWHARVQTMRTVGKMSEVEAVAALEAAGFTRPE